MRYTIVLKVHSCLNIHKDQHERDLDFTPID